VSGPEAVVGATHLRVFTDGSVVALSGLVHTIIDGTRTVPLRDEHPLTTRVTGGVCALEAVMAAFAGLHDPTLDLVIDTALW